MTVLIYFFTRSVCWDGLHTTDNGAGFGIRHSTGDEASGDTQCMTTCATLTPSTKKCPAKDFNVLPYTHLEVSP